MPSETTKVFGIRLEFSLYSEKSFARIKTLTPYIMCFVLAESNLEVRSLARNSLSGPDPGLPARLRFRK